ncbi:toxin-antitoxin system HicB family antitoxin [Natribacillus halophilus]|uniref:HicB family protein n=1 Tax=Natribacillus halophilus TaxID=549003 RepID=A0A1G8LD24_9BACI|nr:toxin-antitoxin system HicB family antitoxin [Natribacillus halophilus]SDI53619.1 HicB family protein [Natribacillus halophilus]
MLDEGEPIPEPIEDENFSDHLHLRMPKSLHRHLAQAAKLEGVS